jgi:hypothetical protein
MQAAGIQKASQLGVSKIKLKAGSAASTIKGNMPNSGRYSKKFGGC